MDFFKSVFSDPDSPSPSSPSSPNPPPDLPSSSPSSSWPLGSSIFKTLADSYYKDLQEFTSGFRNETSLIRQVASRAVQDLPARLESGAAIAQDSLEAVGQAIDDVGSTVSEIIGKDLNFANLRFNDNNDDNSSTSGNPDRDLNLSGDAKPYSRLDAMVRGLQCDFRTYCDEVEEIGYDDWRIGFGLEEKREEIERLMDENGVIREIYSEVVPRKVDEETFWCRYFYRVDKVVKAEEARLRIVKRAISAEDEEELSWDVDDDDNDEESGEGKGNLLKNDVLDGGKGLDETNKGKERANEDAIATVSGSKSGAVVDEGNFVSSEKEGSEGKIESDISVISSQRSSHAEDDMGWDKMEDIGSGDEFKVSEGSSRNSSTANDPRKRLSTAEDDEILTWDIEDN